MPTYKLTYFNVKARAEAARMLFKLAGVDFTDERIAREKWPEMKDNTPFGQMPLLEVDGKAICQSYAINRYLAREFGFAGQDAWENARIDMIADCVEDCFKKATPVFMEKDEEKKTALKKAFIEKDFPDFMTRFEKLIQANGTGFFVGSKVSWVDLVFISAIPLICLVMGNSVDEKTYPNIVAHKKRVEDIPAIAKWIKERPETEM